MHKIITEHNICSAFTGSRNILLARSQTRVLTLFLLLDPLCWPKAVWVCLDDAQRAVVLEEAAVATASLHGKTLELIIGPNERQQQRNSSSTTSTERALGLMYAYAIDLAPSSEGRGALSLPMSVCTQATNVRHTHAHVGVLLAACRRYAYVRSGSGSGHWDPMGYAEKDIQLLHDC